MPDTPPLPGFLADLQSYDAAFIDKVAALRQESYLTPGALDLKTKLLIAMAIDIEHGSRDGTARLAQLARGQGATDAEIAEVVRIVFTLGGMSRMEIATHAFGASG